MTFIIIEKESFLKWIIKAYSYFNYTIKELIPYHIISKVKQSTCIKYISQLSLVELRLYNDINILDPNSSLIDVDIGNDRTYYYSNQNYKNINEKIIKLEPISNNIYNNIALFVGEGNIFNLLPTLSNYVSQFIIIDRDNRVIDYKRNELEAFIKSESVYDFHTFIINYVSKVNPIYLTIGRQMALIGLKLAYNMPNLSEDDFINIKTAITKVNILFLQMNIMDQNKIIQLGNAIRKKGKQITFINRTNLIEYETHHMQIKFFKKAIPEFKNIIDNFQFLPIDENAIVLFGISLEKEEQTYVVKGWSNSIILEKKLIEDNKKYHIK